MRQVVSVAVAAGVIEKHQACMQLAEKLGCALSLSMRTQDETRREIAAGFLDLVLADMADTYPENLGLGNPFPEEKQAHESAL